MKSSFSKAALGIASVCLTALITTALPTLARAATVRQFTVVDHNFNGARAAGASSNTIRTYVSSPLRAKGAFNLAGLTWRGKAGVRVWLRVSKGGGHWTPWRRVTNSYDDGPDSGSREFHSSVQSTQPVWAGRVHRIQYRISGQLATVRDPKLKLIDSIAELNDASPATASSATAQPAIITRAQWGADKCKPKAPPLNGQVDLAFVHHTVSLNDYTPEESASIVLGICRFHQDTNGWNDIGYNFLVDKYGQIFEGRAGGIEAAIVGAQAQGYNSVSTGVASIGDFTSIGQTPEGLAALEKLIAWKLSLNNVPAKGTLTVTSGGGSLNRYPAGQQVTLNRISGHRDGDATDCPGNALYDQLPEIRSATAALITGQEPRTSQVSLVAKSKRVPLGRSAVLSGTVTTTDGAPVTGQALRIQSASGHGWRELARLKSNAAGSFKLKFKPKTAAKYRTRLAGSKSLARVHSQTLKLRVTAAPAPARRRRGK